MKHLRQGSLIQNMNLTTNDFNYNLPEELIAQYPLKKRESARMMVLDRTTKSIEHKHFFDIIDYLNKDDVLVLNNTKVFPARLIAKRYSGGEVEVFLLNPTAQNNQWFCLMKRSKRVKEGETLFVNEDFKIKIIKKDTEQAVEGELPKNIVELEFSGDDVYEILNKYGSIPLPPYISRQTNEDDKQDYQTVFAKNIGSVAAPTAGLHFSKEILEKIKNKGVEIVYITLNVGLGTFLPVKVEDFTKHKMHHESFIIPEETANTINSAKGSVIAAGTTVLRTLEATYQKYGKIVALQDETDIFIYPPYKIKSIDKLITNFHLPKSTLIMLVSAFAGKDFIFSAYQEAIKEKYRFFSYGDCMLIN